MPASKQTTAPAAGEKRRHSIAAKIVFLVFLCTFSTAVVLSAIAIRAQHRQLREQVDQGFRAALERSSEAMELWLLEGEAGLLGLAAGPGERQRFAAAAARPTAKRRGEAVPLLAAFAEASLHFDRVALVAADGRWLVHSEGFELAEGAALDPAPAGDAVTRRSLTTADGVAAVAIAPVQRGNPKAGFLVAAYDPRFLGELLRQQRHDVAAGLVMTDAEGRTLARVAGSGDAPEDAASALAVLRSETPGDVREYASPSGVHSLGARLPLPPRGDDDLAWELVAELPHAAAFAPLTDLLTRIFAVDLLLSIAFIAAAYRISTRMLRPIEDLAEAARAASAGDFRRAIPDPGTYDEIGRLTRVFNEMMEKLHDSQSDLTEANRELLARNDDLQRANEVLSQLSITDGLTKLHNHRYFQECLTREIKRQSRTAKPLSMLLVDLDDFKALNDRLGHASGDELLVRVASILDATVRESDLLARYGGEEFVVLAIDTDLEGATALAEKIRMNVEQAPHIVNESLRPVRITVSVGVAQYAGNRRAFFEAADRALYRAKDEGKNCVIAAEDPLQES